MKIGVQMFAALREIAGDSRVELELPARADVASLIRNLLERYPAMERWKQHMRVAVNQRYVGTDHALQDHDEVAIIPPVSGG